MQIVLRNDRGCIQSAPELKIAKGETLAGKEIGSVVLLVEEDFRTRYRQKEH